MGSAGRRMLNAPYGLPNTFSILYLVVQSQGHVSMLNESVADIGDADCKVELKMQGRFFQWIGSQDGSCPERFMASLFPSWLIPELNVSHWIIPGMTFT